MPYAAIMVHVDLEPESETRLRAACALAQRLDAAVIGVSACGPMPYAYAHGGFGVAIALVEPTHKEIEARLREAEAQFRAVTGGLKVSAEWRSEAASPTAYVIRQARAADLIVVGSNPQGELSPSLHNIDPADLALQAGRPALVMPAGIATIAADAVVVAWKDTRECRRAIADALPLLRLCRKAVVVEVLEDERLAAPQAGVRDVRAWLERHGVPALETTIEKGGSVADHLEQAAEEHQADLIVAGAYGHSRLQEWVLGGVTRHLLTQTARPVFLAH